MSIRTVALVLVLVGPGSALSAQPSQRPPARAAAGPTDAWLRIVSLRADREASLEAMQEVADERAMADSTAENLYWVAALAGLRAETAGPLAKVRLGKQAWEATELALQRDSLHAGAHHVAGRLHAGVLRLSSVVRFAAARLGLGDLLAQASWESAEFHLEKAHELEPDQPTYLMELGAFHAERADTARAIELLEQIRARTPRDPWDGHLRDRACQELVVVGRVEDCAGVEPRL